MNTKKALILTIIFCPILILTSCALTRSSYTPDDALRLPPKNAESVEFFNRRPSNSIIRLGVVSVEGNEFTRRKDLIKKAKKKAAKVGGDFILMEESGVKHEQEYIPGSSSKQIDASWGSDKGSYQSSSHSSGPEVIETSRPWAHFSVWAYTPAQLGIKLDDAIVTGFYLNSDAETSGIQVGDKLIGIDGYDIQDQHLTSHMMNIQPGTEVTIHVRRKGKRLDFPVITIPN